MSQLGVQRPALGRRTTTTTALLPLPPLPAGGRSTTTRALLLLILAPFALLEVEGVFVERRASDEKEASVSGLVRRETLAPSHSHSHEPSKLAPWVVEARRQQAELAAHVQEERRQPVRGHGLSSSKTEAALNQASRMPQSLGHAGSQRAKATSSKRHQDPTTNRNPSADSTTEPVDYPIYNLSSEVATDVAASTASQKQAAADEAAAIVSQKQDYEVRFAVGTCAPPAKGTNYSNIESVSDCAAICRGKSACKFFSYSSDVKECVSFTTGCFEDARYDDFSTYTLSRTSPLLWSSYPRSGAGCNYSIATCKAAATAAGLQIGDGPSQENFLGEYPTKGCFTYGYGSYKYRVYYGTVNGTELMAEPTSELQEPIEPVIRPPRYPACPTDPDLPAYIHVGPGKCLSNGEEPARTIISGVDGSSCRSSCDGSENCFGFSMVGDECLLWNTPNLTAGGLDTTTSANSTNSTISTNTINCFAKDIEMAGYLHVSDTSSKHYVGGEWTNLFCGTFGLLSQGVGGNGTAAGCTNLYTNGSYIPSATNWAKISDNGVQDQCQSLCADHVQHNGTLCCWAHENYGCYIYPGATLTTAGIGRTSICKFGFGYP